MRFFDECDLADWELSVQVGLTVLAVPELMHPAQQTVGVLPLPRYLEGSCFTCHQPSITLSPFSLTCSGCRREKLRSEYREILRGVGN